MTAFTTYTDGTTVASASGSNAASYPAVTTIQGVFDASRRNLAAADTMEVLNIPAGTFVHKVMYKVLTGDATQTLNVGDGVDPDGYVAVADVATAGNVGVGAGAFATGKFYATADTIDIEVPATKAFDTLKVSLVAVVSVVS